MSNYKLKKAVIGVTCVASFVITFHMGVVIARYFTVGIPVVDMGLVTALAMFMGLQNLILGFWCYDHVRREERVREMYPEVRHG